MKNIKRIMACILVVINLFSITSCGKGMEKLESEKQALQQQIEALEQQNSSIQANKENLQKEKQALQQQIEALEKENSSIQSSIQTDKESLQNQMDGINNAPQLIEEYQAIIERQKLYGIPLHVNVYEKDNWYLGPRLAQFLVVSDRNIFDIDDVRLKIYYGSDYPIEQLSEKSCDYYEIAVNSHGASLPNVSIKIEGNYYTQENQVEVTLDEKEDYIKEIKYKKFIEISIPAEIFNEEKNPLMVALRTFKKEGNEDILVEEYKNNLNLIYYKSEDGTKVFIWNNSNMLKGSYP